MIIKDIFKFTGLATLSSRLIACLLLARRFRSMFPMRKFIIDGVDLSPISLQRLTYFKILALKFLTAFLIKSDLTKNQFNINGFTPPSHFNFQVSTVYARHIIFINSPLLLNCKSTYLNRFLWKKYGYPHFTI